jgi:hypothetical protein
MKKIAKCYAKKIIGGNQVNNYWINKNLLILVGLFLVGLTVLSSNFFQRIKSLNM